MLTDDQIADAIPTSAKLMTTDAGRAVLMRLEDLREFARALESRACNAGGAVWIQRDHLEKAKTGAYLCRVEAEYRDGMGFVPLYPAPASKEPVADEREAFAAYNPLGYVQMDGWAVWQAACAWQRSKQAHIDKRYRWLRKVGGYLAHATDEGYDAAVDAAMYRDQSGEDE